MMTFKGLFLLMALGSCMTTSTQTTGPDAGEPIQLENPLESTYFGRPASVNEARKRAILIVGQSNAVGGGEQTDLTDTSYQATVSGVTSYSKVAVTSITPLNWTEWTDDVLGPRKQANGTRRYIGVEIKGGRDLMTRWGSGNVIMIKIAVSGTDLGVQWLSTGTYPADTGDNRNLAQQTADWANIELAKNNAELAAIWWIQGEADSGDSAMAAAYETNLRNLIAFWRGCFGGPTLPFVYNSVSTSLGGHPYQSTVRAAQTALDAEANNYMVSPSGLALESDNTHYTADSFITLGARFAAATPDP